MRTFQPLRCELAFSIFSSSLLVGGDCRCRQPHIRSMTASLCTHACNYNHCRGAAITALIMQNMNDGRVGVSSADDCPPQVVRAGPYISEKSTAAFSPLHFTDSVRASHTAILTTVLSILSLMQCDCAFACRVRVTCVLVPRVYPVLVLATKRVHRHTGRPPPCICPCEALTHSTLQLQVCPVTFAMDIPSLRTQLHTAHRHCTSH